MGLNSWQSQGAAPAPDSAPGLLRIDFELAGSDALGELERSLGELASEPPAHEDDGSMSLRDPDGQLLTFRSG